MSWGFLMGVGKGLSEGADVYGRMMDTKRKNDFQLKRDELSFERSKALKDLEFQNQSKRDDLSYKRQTERDDLAHKRLTEREEIKRRQLLEDREQAKTDELDMYKEKKKLDSAYQQESLQASYEFQKLKSKEERDAKAEELKQALTDVDGEYSFRDQLMVLSAKTGQDLTNIYGKDGKVSPEVIDTVSNVMMNNKEMQELSEKNPQAYLALVSEYAYRTQHGKNRGSGRPAPGDSHQGPDVNAIGTEIGNSKTKAERDQKLDDVKEKYGEDVYNQVAEISHGISGDATQSPAPQGGGALSNTQKPKIYRPTSENMSKMRKEHPGMTEKWYKSQYQSWAAEKDSQGQLEDY